LDPTPGFGSEACGAPVDGGAESESPPTTSAPAPAFAVVACGGAEEPAAVGAPPSPVLAAAAVFAVVVLAWAAERTAAGDSAPTALGAALALSSLATRCGHDLKLCTVFISVLSSPPQLFDDKKYLFRF